MQELFSPVNQINVIAEMLEIGGDVGRNEDRPALIFGRVFAQQVENLISRFHIESCGRLVEDQKLCLV